MVDISLSFLVITDLFDRYIIIVSDLTGKISIYCEECEQWVDTYDSDQLSESAPDELYEKIITDHEYQVKGVPVSFDDSIETFL